MSLEGKMAELVVVADREEWRSGVQVQPRLKGDQISRTYSAKYVSSSLPKDFRLEESDGYSGSKSLRFAGWNCLNDPEIQRKKRIANYRAYSVESKMKGSFRKSFRWIKDRYKQVVRA
ncbi:hypothetical protein ZOSMA_154G00470 [Zostera marina]|uniref:DUF3511 domain-containing protein n=1 Tax=Zostera marina TaxID=29655 RepID=A0A0K9PVS3_ZOSMR|nr:hypothetical protein ZOSMA_154G00470 [Zostera marina]